MAKATNRKNKPEVPKRLAPTMDTLRLLFSFSGNQCAFPGCNNKLFSAKNKFIAEVCHIEGALKGGERFNPKSNNQERRSYNNLVLLCKEHHVETDDELTYTTAVMRSMKADHENQFRGDFYANQDMLDDAFRIELENSLRNIEQNTIDIKKFLEDQKQSIMDSADVLHDIQRKVNDVSRQFPVIQSGNKDYNKKFDDIYEYKHIKKPQIAIDLFQDFKKENWEKFSAQEKYRILTLIGLCYIDLGKMNEAAKHFIEGLEHQPENTKAINFGILGYSILERTDDEIKWINLGLQIDPRNTGILSSLIRQSQEADTNDVIKKIPEDLLSDPEISLELAKRYLKQGDTQKATKWTKICLKNSLGDKYEIKALLATILLHSFSDEFTLFSGQFSHQHISDANYIIKLYTEAWSEIEHTELKTSRAWYLLNRGIAKKVIGDLEGFYDDSVLAGMINPEYTVQFHVLKVALELGKESKFFEVLNNLRKIADDEQLRTLDFHESQMLTSLNKIGEAETKLHDMLQLDLGDKIKENALLDLISIYIGTNRSENAVPYVDMLEQLVPDKLVRYLVRAKLDADLGIRSLADGLNEAKKNISATTKKSELNVLAKYFESNDQIKEAIEIYEMVVDTEVYSDLTNKLLKLYYDDGQTQKILTIAESLLQRYGPNWHCTELVSYVYERIHDEDKAIKACKKYLEVYPDDQRIRFRLASIYQRINDLPRLKDQLSYFNHLNKGLPLDVQFDICRYLAEVGDDQRALKFAYEIRRENFDRANAHSNFINLTLYTVRDNRRPKASDAVSIDSWIKVKSDTAEIDFIIENRNDVLPSRGELSLNSFEAQALIGKKVGELVSIDPRDPDLAMSIVNVSHKIDFAIHESLELLRTRFTTQTNLTEHKLASDSVSQNPLESIFKVLEPVRQRNKQIDDLFAAGHLTIGAVGMLKSKNPIEVWKDICSSTNLSVNIIGQQGEIQQAIAQIQGGVSMVLDVISLLTIFHIGFQDQIQKLPNKKIVLKSTVDQIQQYLKEIEKNKESGRINIEKINGVIVSIVTTPLQIAQEMAMLSSILYWINQNCSVVPTTAALKFNDREKLEWDKNLGESFMDSILTAQAEGALIYTEESLLRGLAFQEFTVHGISTLAILLNLREKEQINSDVFTDSICKFIALRYTGFPSNIAVLYKCARETELLLKEPLLSALAALASPFMKGTMSAEVALGFIVALIRNPIAISDINERDIRIENIIKAILSILIRLYVPNTIRDPFVNNLKVRLAGVEGSQLVFNAIDAFFKDLG